MITGTILSGIFEHSYVGSSTTGIFGGLMTSYEHVDFSNPLIGLWSIARVGWSFLGLLWSMFWWDYSFFYGDYIIFRYIGLAISIGVIAAILLPRITGARSS